MTALVGSWTVPVKAPLSIWATAAAWEASTKSTPRNTNFDITEQQVFSAKPPLANRLGAVLSAVSICISRLTGNIHYKPRRLDIQSSCHFALQGVSRGGNGGFR